MSSLIFSLVRADFGRLHRQEWVGAVGDIIRRLAPSKSHCTHLNCFPEAENTWDGFFTLWTWYW